MKKFLVIALVVILLAGCAGGLYVWYQQTHVFIEEAVYDKDAEFVDLRGSGVSMDHYLQLCAALPECTVVWDVPFQGRDVDSESTSIAITNPTAEDISMLSYFTKLESVDASGCSDYAMLENLHYAYPELQLTYQVELGGTACAPDAEELVLAEGAYDYDTLMLNLVHLPQVRTIHLPNTRLSLGQLEEIGLMYPGIQLSYTVSFRGQECDPNLTEMDLSDLKPEEVAQVAQELAYFPNLADVQLMNGDGQSQLSLVDVQTLQEAAPAATFHYSFTFYKKTLSTTDTSVEYRNIYMKDSDEEQIRQILDVMDDCETFVFNNCHISNEIMAGIREDYREKTKVVWRVFFGNGGSCLTDRQVIKMVYGLTNSNSKALQYCEDVKYIDFGHNETLTDISFIAHMPNLEAIILSGSPIRDLTPFEGHKNLYFLEIAYCGYIEDLSPLKNCTNLGMLNISYSAVTDLSPLDGLNLERLTMVKTDVEEEEILRYSEVNPACWVVYKGDQPYGKGWRYDQDGSQSAYYKKIAAPDIFNYANTSDTNW